VARSLGIHLSGFGQLVSVSLDTFSISYEVPYQSLCTQPTPYTELYLRDSY